jgi:hypothetical protein
MSTLGEDHIDVGQRRNNLAVVMRRMGDLDGAREQLELAVAIAEAIHGRDHSAYRTARANLESVIADQGEERVRGE